MLMVQLLVVPLDSRCSGHGSAAGKDACGDETRGGDPDCGGWADNHGCRFD